MPDVSLTTAHDRVVVYKLNGVYISCVTEAGITKCRCQVGSTSDTRLGCYGSGWLFDAGFLVVLSTTRQKPD